MGFSDLFSANSKILSFEFFPPRKSEDIFLTKTLISDLVQTSPDFVTVTYGAGGGTRGLTKELVSYIHNQLNLNAVAHLTCVGHSRDEIKTILEELAHEGVNNILALRGDPPKGVKDFQPHPQGFKNARELTKFIKSQGDFSVAVAGYPEMHKDASSLEKDIEYLKEKVDAGAELILTQLFFENKYFYKFRDLAVKAGIKIPIVPGLMPISNVSQVKKFTSLCGTSIPNELTEQLNKMEDNPDEVIQYGIEYTIKQAEDLLKQDVRGIHLYTLNKSVQVMPIVSTLRSLELL
ncbi:MAG: methylenetetrahydrofolate reductase [NAD(P)H] [Proteobacteria bacterium]|nr:methylenetetrahydrofolate reductase [NAD(P)H] [Pseudomonadota bacterium]